MQLMNSLATPTPRVAVKILNFLLICEGKEDFIVMSIFANDWYILRQQIAMAHTSEAEVNGKLIPCVKDAKKPKYVNRKFAPMLIKRIPVSGKALAAFLLEHFGVSHSFIAPVVLLYLHYVYDVKCTDSLNRLLANLFQDASIVSKEA